MALHQPRLTICNCKHGTHRTFCQVCDCPSSAVENLICFEGRFTDITDRGGLPGRVGTFNVTLQLERGGKLVVAVLAQSVDFPALTLLPLKVQMVPHVGHKLHIF